METSRETYKTTAQAWNGAAGNAWVDSQELLDSILRPYENLLVDEVRDLPARDVLDVGCGSGGTTVAVQRALGARCLGADVSAPMVEAARARAEREGSPVEFLLADVQRHSFEAASFDLIVSRFGVMFFDDPVAAFANLRRATRDGGELRFIAWRSMAENPFMTTAETAAEPLLPNLPVRDPDGPGQFAFADRDRVTAILTESGWGRVELEPVDAECTMPEPSLIPYFSRLGRVGMVLHEVDEETRARVLSTVRAAFEPFVDGDTVRFTGACWMGRAAAV